MFFSSQQSVPVDVGASGTTSAPDVETELLEKDAVSFLEISKKRTWPWMFGCLASEIRGIAWNSYTTVLESMVIVSEVILIGLAMIHECWPLFSPNPGFQLRTLSNHWAVRGIVQCQGFVPGTAGWNHAFVFFHLMFVVFEPIGMFTGNERSFLHHTWYPKSGRCYILYSSWTWLFWTGGYGGSSTSVQCKCWRV